MFWGECEKYPSSSDDVEDEKSDCDEFRESEGEGVGIRSGNATSLTILSPQWSTPNSSDRPTQARSGDKIRTSLEVGEWDLLRGDAGALAAVCGLLGVAERSVVSGE